jgi:hypothetical protein
MQIHYTQGLLRGQQDPTTAAKLFLQKSGLNIGIYVTDQPLQAVACHKGNHYLIVEPVNISVGWTVPIGACWLYWDISLTTGAITRGQTIVAPAFGTIDPAAYYASLSITPAQDQHYYNKTTMQHYAYASSTWVECVRVFAATINSSGVLTAMSFASQVGIIGEYNAGFIIYSLGGTPLLDPTTSTFLNTGTGYMIKTSGNGLVQLDLSYEPLIGVSAQSLPALSVVRLRTDGLYELADGPSNKPGIALCLFGTAGGSVFRPQPIGLVRGNFQFSSSDISKTVWLGAAGALLTTQPVGYASQVIGIVLGTDALLLTIR